MPKSLVPALCFMICATPSLMAQNSDFEEIADTARVLNEVVIQAYAYKRPSSEVPAAVAVVTQKEFERFNNTSFLPAVNTIPGVRMEERSPEHRFRFGGSLLRSLLVFAM